MNKKEYFLAPGLLICAGEARCKITLFGRELEIRLISAYKMALCIKEAKKLEKKLLADHLENSRELAKSACLCAACLYDGLGKIFETGEEALQSLTADEITLIIENYTKLRKEDFDVFSLENQDFNRLKIGMQNSGLERIRWKVLRAFDRLPCDLAVRRMTDGQFLYCYVNLLLDRETVADEYGINQKYQSSERGSHE